MKKILIFAIIFSFLLSINNVQAKFPDDLPGPELMPDSPFYFLKIWWEKIVIFFTFDAVKKADKYVTFAEKRIYEAKEMLEKGKDELAEKAKEKYRIYLNKALDKLESETKKAIEYRAEEMKRKIEQKIEEIKIKLKQSINL